MTLIGDTLDRLRADDIRRPVSSIRPALDASGVTNQQILDATKAFYAANQSTVDTTTANTNDVATNQSAFVSQYNGNTTDFQAGTLSSGAQSQSDTAIFGDDGTGGIFGPTLDDTKASDLFTTVCVGVSVEAIVGIGGYGGLGCAFDIAKRESPVGYGFATLELGLKVAADINIQAAIFNQLPSDLVGPIYGLNVGVDFGIGVGLQVFYQDLSNLTVIGYGISAGVGIGGGAAVFGGKLWSFG